MHRSPRLLISDRVKAGELGASDVVRVDIGEGMPGAAMRCRAQSEPLLFISCLNAVWSSALIERSSAPICASTLTDIGVVRVAPSDRRPLWDPTIAASSAPCRPNSSAIVPPKQKPIAPVRLESPVFTLITVSSAERAWAHLSGDRTARPLHAGPSRPFR